jgi:hypothetical protein
MKTKYSRKYLIALIFLLGSFSISAQTKLIEESLIAFWDFSEEAGNPRVSKSFTRTKEYLLLEGGGKIQKIHEGPIGDSSADISDSTWFYIPRNSLGALNIFGKDGHVTVIAWIRKESHKSWQAIAGVWDESRLKRQYYMFLNAHSKTHYDEMVRYPASGLLHGHISATGGKSPGQVAWISYSSSGDSVPENEWTCIAITYDGKEIKSYINGKLSASEFTNPFPYEEGILMEDRTARILQLVPIP